MSHYRLLLGLLVLAAVADFTLRVHPSGAHLDGVRDTDFVRIIQVNNPPPEEMPSLAGLFGEAAAGMSGAADAAAAGTVREVSDLEVDGRRIRLRAVLIEGDIRRAVLIADNGRGRDEELIPARAGEEVLGGYQVESIALTAVRLRRDGETISLLLFQPEQR